MLLWQERTLCATAAGLIKPPDRIDLRAFAHRVRSYPGKGGQNL